MRKLKTVRKKRQEVYKQLSENPEKILGKSNSIEEKSFYDEIFEEDISRAIVNKKIDGNHGLEFVSLLKFLNAEQTLGRKNARQLFQELQNSPGAIPILNSALFSLDKWNSSNYEKLIDEKIELLNSFIELLNVFDKELSDETKRLNPLDIPKVAKQKLNRLRGNLKSQIKDLRDEINIQRDSTDYFKEKSDTKNKWSDTVKKVQSIIDENLRNGNVITQRQAIDVLIKLGTDRTINLELKIKPIDNIKSNILRAMTRLKK